VVGNGVELVQGVLGLVLGVGFVEVALHVKH